MAGNTKLRGFAAGNKVQLERWGERAMVQLDEGSHAALMNVCKTVLPTTPPPRPEGAAELFTADFVPDMGNIFIRLNLESAELLKGFFEDNQVKLGEQAEDWLHEIEHAIDQYNAFYDSSDEPGVE